MEDKGTENEEVFAKVLLRPSGSVRRFVGRRFIGFIYARRHISGVLREL